MKYATVCSGIEAPSAAWQPIGWEPLWFSEIEPFPCAVLAAHHPDVPNVGDMKGVAIRILMGELPAPDVFCGGTPCQAFSVAGLRGGLADARGNLALTFIEVCNAIDDVRSTPAVHLWENVPGVLSSKDNAFGCFLAGLAGESVPLVAPGGKWPNAGWVVGPQRTVAWRVLDAQYFGVAQRRRRVFVVASAGATDPREILFEREGVRRDFAPSRETGESITTDAGGGVKVRSHWDGGPHPSLTQAHNTGGIGASNQELFSQGGAGLVPAVTAKWAKGTGGPAGDECQNLVAINCGPAHTLRGEGFDASEDGTGRGTPLVPVAFPINTLALGGRPNPANDARMTFGVGNDGDPQFTLQTNHSRAVATPVRVRRLTPRECERLQGFPDDWTAITYRGKPAADGPRYKALGNSMAVPVIRWIGERIDRCCF